MKLEIGKTEADGSMRYHILYGTDSTGLRPYTLIPSDHEKGKYLLDENNGIKIEMNLARNVISSVFEVMGSLNVTHTSLQDSILEYSIYAGKFTDPLISGETIHEGDTIPKVQSWSIPTMQRAILKKAKM
jgi:hypothetical protein